jgi:hypothetical protein
MVKYSPNICQLLCDYIGNNAPFPSFDEIRIASSAKRTPLYVFVKQLIYGQIGPVCALPDGFSHTVDRVFLGYRNPPDGFERLVPLLKAPTTFAVRAGGRVSAND